MTNPQRTQLTDEHCPRCAAPIREHLIGRTSAEDDEVLAWLPTRRGCSAGCLLTVADFAGPTA